MTRSKTSHRPPTRPSGRSRRLTSLELLVLALFFGSGASALVYEVVWSRKLTYVFGGSAFAIATVLAAYMAGLALGSAWFGRKIDRRGHPLVVYGILEAAIGVFALVLPWILEVLDRFYAGLYQSLDLGFYPLSLIRFVLSFLVLLIPTTMMGGTLPVLGKFLLRDPRGLGSKAGLLYGMNTIGAVVGVVFSGFILIPALGLSSTTLLAVAVNAVVALGAIGASRSYRHGTGTAAGTPDIPPPSATPAASPRLRRGVLLVYAASGFAALSYEVAWTKVLSMILGTNTYAFTSMLSTFLLGLSLGAFVFGKLADRYGRPILLLGVVQLAISLSCLLTIPVLAHLPQAFVDNFAAVDASWIGIELLRVALAGVTMIVPTFLMGGTFPLVTRAYVEQGNLGRSLGVLYSWNTVGAIGGSFLTGFVFIPLIGRQNSILLATIINLAAAGMLFVLLRRETLPRLLRGVAVVLVAAMVPAAIVGARPWNPKVLSAGAYYRPREIAKKPSIEEFMAETNILFYKESTEATIAVFQDRHVTSLRINGKVDASSHGDMVTQKLVSHVPAYYHSGRDLDAALIGLASGISAGALLTHPIRRLDCIELVGPVKEAAAYFDYYNRSCLDDPRFHYIVNDGRNQLRLSDRTYDLIISEPTNPWIAGVGALFTREFFQLARSRLKPGGVFCQWVQLYQMRTEEIQTILGTFADEFPYVHIWTGDPGDLIMVGSLDPLRMEYDALAASLDEPSGKDLEDLQLTPIANFLGYFVSDREGVLRFVGDDRRRVTDDNLYLEYAIPRHMFDAAGLANQIEFNPIRKSPLLLFDRKPGPVAEAAINAYHRAHLLSLEGFFAAALPESLRTADDAYRAAITIAPRERLARHRLGHDINEAGIQALRRGDTAGARAQFGQAIRLGSKEEEALAWNNLGYIQFQEGHRDSARVCWENSRRREPFSPTVNENLGLLASLEGDYATAVERYETALRFDPEDAELMTNVAYNRIYAGEDPARAAVLADRAVKLDATPTGLMVLAMTRVAAEDWSEALKLLTRVLNEDPKNAEARYFLARAELGSGRSDDARRSFEQVLAESADQRLLARVRTALETLGSP